MKRIFSLVLVFCAFNANSQNNISLRASQLQLELFGPGSLFSFNFDSRFLKSEKGLGYKIGFGGSPLGFLGKSCNSGTLLTLPAGLSFSTGRNNHNLELGAGGVVGIVNSTKIYCIDFKQDFFSDEAIPYAYLSAGYRFQPVGKKGMTYRLFLSPLFQKKIQSKNLGWRKYWLQVVT